MQALESIRELRNVKKYVTPINTIMSENNSLEGSQPWNPRRPARMNVPKSVQ